MSSDGVSADPVTIERAATHDHEGVIREAVVADPEGAHPCGSAANTSSIRSPARRCCSDTVWV